MLEDLLEWLQSWTIGLIASKFDRFTFPRLAIGVFAIFVNVGEKEAHFSGLLTMPSFLIRTRLVLTGGNTYSPMDAYVRPKRTYQLGLLTESLRDFVRLTMNCRGL